MNDDGRHDRRTDRRDRWIGQTLGRYRIDSTVGWGGFATVYRAVDTILERPVALKVLDAAALRDPTNSRRFLRERQAVANLDHPAIVPIYDAGEDDGVPWMAMRLVEGGSLDQALASGRRFDREETLALVRRIASALDHAHGQELIHRDVKPSNILLEGGDPDTAWLTDFGIAVTVRDMGHYTTGALGTAAYMAPEQAQPNQAGPAADLYSLACVAFELVTGERPFPGRDYVALLMAHLREPVPPTGDAALDEFTARALAKEPGQRPTSGRALTEDLERALEGPPTARAPGPATGAGAEPGSAGSAPMVVESAESAPTVVEAREHTLVQPVPPTPPVPPPAPPSPQPGAFVGPAGAAPYPPPAGPPPPRSRRGLVSLITGLVLLAAVATAAVLVTVVLRDSDGSRVVRINDDAGVVYEIPTDWSYDIEGTVTTLSDADGTTVAVLSHESLVGEPSLESLSAPDECVEPPAEVAAAPGADATARCVNPSDSPIAQVTSVIADGRLWTVVVHRVGPDEARDAFAASLEFTSETSQE